MFLRRQKASKLKKYGQKSCELQNLVASKPNRIYDIKKWWPYTLLMIVLKMLNYALTHTLNNLSAVIEI